MAGDSGVSSVLEALEAVIDESWRTRSRDGFFACLYHKVTQKVAEGIATGFFDDPERMERLDVAFAQRYLDARDALRTGRRPTRSWEAAFDAARQRRHVIAQHLLVAVNAHINLDLGIAAAVVAPGDQLPPLRRDFDRINEILASLIAEVLRDLGTVPPWIGLLDTLGGRHDDEVLRFSIVVARSEAWRFASELAALPPDQHPGPIQARDAAVAGLARRVLSPGPLLTPVVWLVRLRETADVREVIDFLRRVPAPDLDEVERRVTSRRAPER